MVNLPRGGRKVAYFLGASIHETEAEMVFEKLYASSRKIYVTLSEEVKARKLSLGKETIVADVFGDGFRFRDGSDHETRVAAFLPMASRWAREKRANLLSRYNLLANMLVEKGTDEIVFYALEEEASQWNVDVNLLTVELVKMFYENFPAQVEILWVKSLGKRSLRLRMP